MTLSGKTVLVTGATGFLGGYLCNRLGKQGAVIRALARRPNRDRYIRDVPGLEIVMGDITDGDQMRDMIQGVDIVFHVAAATHGAITHQQRVNVDGTHNVIQAAAGTRVRRVVYVSSVSVYGYGVRGDVTEDIPLDPGAADPYHRTKIAAEEAVREIGQQHNMEYAIIRPGMIYGPRSNTWTRMMFKVARRKPTIWIGDGSGSAFPIYVEDVVDLMILLATHSGAAGEAFNCAPDPGPTWREYLGEYAALAGHDRWLGIPPLLLKPVAWLGGTFAPKHSQLKDLSALLDLVTSTVNYRMDKARQRLGWEAQVSLEDGVRRCVPYLREKGLLD